MFVREDDGSVRSTEGFTFRLAGLFSAEYREGERLIYLDTVPGPPATFVLIDRGTLRWTGGARLSAAEHERVLANIRSALRFMGRQLEEGF